MPLHQPPTPASITIPVELYDHDRHLWRSGARLEIIGGSLQIHGPYGEQITVCICRQSIRFRGLRNWLGVVFGKQVFCRSDDVVCDPAGRQLHVNLGFPFDDPLVVRFSQEHTGEIMELCRN